VVQTGAVIMLILAVIGKFGALFTTIPDPVVGMYSLFCDKNFEIKSHAVTAYSAYKLLVFRTFSLFP